MSMSPKLTTKVHPDLCSPTDVNSCCVTLSKAVNSSANISASHSGLEKHSKPLTPKEKLRKFCAQVQDMETLSKLIAEFTGTGLMMFGGCSGCLAWGKEPVAFFGAISFGLTVMMLIQCYGAVSGAHFNPAVTLAAIIFKLISVPMGVLYFFAQLCGAIVGYGLLKALTPVAVFNEVGVPYGFCTTVPQEDLTAFQAFMHEYIATMLLITLCCSVWDPRNLSHQDSVALKFGLSITILSFTFGRFTGCSMNPVRSFAPALWNRSFVMHWIYWVGPMLSATITSLLYKLLFWPTKHQLQLLKH